MAANCSPLPLLPHPAGKSYDDDKLPHGFNLATQEIPELHLTPKNKNKPPKGKPGPRPSPADDQRPAVAVTVAWMLTTICSAAAQLLTLVMWLVARSAGIPEGRPNALAVIPDVMLMVAFLTGLLALILTPITLRTRRSPPPRAITIAAVLVGLSPLVIIAARSLWR